MQGEATPVFTGGRREETAGGQGSQEKSLLLHLGLCTCLYLCGAESKDFSGTRLLGLPLRHSKDIPVGKYWVRSEKPSQPCCGGCRGSVLILMSARSPNSIPNTELPSATCREAEPL